MEKVKERVRTNRIKKNQTCVTVNFLLCGESYQKAAELKEKFNEKYKGNLAWPAAINMLILGEKVA